MESNFSLRFFPYPSPDPDRRPPAWPGPSWPRSCLFPALQGFRMLCLHATGCCGKLSKGNCLMWKGKRWLSRKQSLPLCWGPGLTQKGGNMFEFLTSPCVRNTLGMPGCSLRPAVRQSVRQMRPLSSQTPEPLNKYQVMGTMRKGRDKEETGPARAGKLPGLNGDSQERANVSTGS